MAGRGLGSLTLDLVVKIGAFEQGLDRASRVMNKRANEIEKRANALGRGIGTALKSAFAYAGVSVSIGALIGGLQKTITAMDDMSKSAKKVGLSTEAFSRLSFAADLANVSQEELQSGMGRLVKAQAAAMDSSSQQAKLFDALGIAVKDAVGAMRPTHDVMLDFADAFAKLKGSPEALAAGLSIFGRGFQTFVPLINEGAQAIRNAERESDALGNTLSQKSGEAAEEFNDNLTRLKAAVGGLAKAIASELLPDMVDFTGQLVDSAKDGDGFKKTAHEIAETVRDVAAAISDLIHIFSGLGSVIGSVLGPIHNFLGASDRLAQSITGTSRLGEFLKEKFPILYKEIGSRNNQQQSTTEIPDYLKLGILSGEKPFRATDPVSFSILPKPTDPSAEKIRKALAGEDKKSKNKTGKSDAEKEAERLLKAYEQMSASLKEQAALQGDVSEVEKLRYELANGELAKLNDAQKQSLLTDAAALDQAREAYKLQQDGKALIESLLTPTEQVNELRKEAAELLAAGAIAQADYNKAIESYLTPAQEVIRSLDEELALIGLSEVEQQKMIAVRQAGADATAEEVFQIERKIEALAEAAKAAEFQREIEYGLADAIYDVASGAKSAGDAIKDFFDDLAQYILRMIAENWAKQIAGLFTGQGGASSSGGGTNWFGLIAGLFGGGKAGGGWTKTGGINEVNERGFEMATVGGRDYMLTGSQPVRITPHDQIGGGGVVQNISFNVAGRVSDETRTQAAAKIAYETRRATVRN